VTKFNKTGVRAAPGKSPMQPTTKHGAPTTRTALGGPGYALDAKGEVFRLAVANFVGEDTFHEKADDRDARYAALVRRVAVEDPSWTLEFLRWLRGDGNMRSASLVGAVEAAVAWNERDGKDEQSPGEKLGKPGFGRAVIDAVCQRPDEPGEALAYHLATYGRKIPKSIKRGLADAARRLYNEYALLKYDTPSHGVRFADVLDLTHPSPATPEQGTLFRYALDRRHGHDAIGEFEGKFSGPLPMIGNHLSLRADLAGGDYTGLLDTNRLRLAGFTWEDALSAAGPRVGKAELWSALAPTMGYMALLRNLRNLDEAGVSDDVADAILARLVDPAQVARSRQLPYRFYSAYTEAPSDRWKHGLSKALDLALANVPVLGGRNLVLVDTSGSMTSGTFSARSKRTPAEAAAIFGVALAKRSGAELYGFADGQFEHKVRKGQSTLAAIGEFLCRTGEAGHGTQVHAAVKATLHGHDRVFIISDEQTVDGGRGYSMYGRQAEARDFGTAQVYAFNLGGYRASAFGTAPNIHHLAGLTDATFKLIPMLEAGGDGRWPWQDGQD
jgi:hypothetical protein